MCKNARISGILSLAIIALVIVFAVAGYYYSMSIPLPSPETGEVEGAFRFSGAGIARFTFTIGSIAIGICFLISIPFSIILVSKNRTNKGLLVVNSIIRSLAVTRYSLFIWVAFQTCSSSEYFPLTAIIYMFVGVLTITALIVSMFFEFKALFQIKNNSIDTPIER